MRNYGRKYPGSGYRHTLSYDIVNQDGRGADRYRIDLRDCPPGAWLAEARAAFEKRLEQSLPYEKRLEIGWNSLRGLREYLLLLRTFMFLKDPFIDDCMAYVGERYILENWYGHSADNHSWPQPLFKPRLSCNYSLNGRRKRAMRHALDVLKWYRDNLSRSEEAVAFHSLVYAANARLSTGQDALPNLITQKELDSLVCKELWDAYLYNVYDMCRELNSILESTYS